METYRDLVLALRAMDLDGSRPVIAHGSLSAFGHVKGGERAVVGALLEHFDTVVMPTFTYKTMVVPRVGPPGNAIAYGRFEGSNVRASIYHPKLPADELMGVIPETLRRHKHASRSSHPIMSFGGVNAVDILKSQTIEHPLAPIAALADLNGWALLMGVTHTANTSIHLGEQLARRKSFVRWALVPDRVVTCERYPACSDGFDALQPHVADHARMHRVGEAMVVALPLVELISTVRNLVESNPLALLCDNPECERCNAVREHVQAANPSLAPRPSAG